MSRPSRRGEILERGSRVLLLGATGRLGRALGVELSLRGLEVFAPSRAACNLARLDDLGRLPWRQLRAVVNAAAWTDVDRAEDLATLAMTLNGHAPGEIAARCAKAGIPLVHFSTDYVFDGSSPRPYRPEDEPGPLNLYGETKLAGERAVSSAGGQHLIVRTGGLFAEAGPSFVSTIATVLLEGKEPRCADDTLVRPTSATLLARASVTMLLSGARGIHHVTGGGPPASWFEVAQVVAAQVRPDARVERCRLADLPRRAERPRFTVLDTSSAERVAGLFPSWRGEVEAWCRSRASRLPRAIRA